MFNESFYPTPPRVAEQMLSRFTDQDLRNRTILEPSAGKGDLADALMRHMGQRVDERHRKHIHCIEQEPDLQAAVKGKGYTLVAMDFLTFEAQDQYDLIIMNPPFSNGDQHLLHAWDVLYGGDIVCLLNAATVDHPDTVKRRLLLNIINEHGRIERLGKCFAGMDAFRQTDVDVVLVHLTKDKPEVKFSFEGAEFEHDRTNYSFDASDLSNQVALNDKVGNLVMLHNKCLSIFREIARLFVELDFYSAPFGARYRMLDEVLKEAAHNYKSTYDKERQKTLYNMFSAALKKESWESIFEMTNMANLVSTKVRSDFKKFCDDNKTLSFSRANINALLSGLFHSRNDIFRTCIEEVFDRMTRYDKRNTAHVEGWKTNDAYKVNRKVIVPIAEYGFDNEWWRDKASMPHHAKERLNDIDKAMGFLVGKTQDQVLTIVQAIKAHVGERGTDRFNFQWFKEPFESEFFQCRVYLKGTIHLTFKDPWLWEKFNIEAARGKNWLPDDYKEREMAADQYAVVPRFNRAATA